MQRSERLAIASVIAVGVAVSLGTGCRHQAAEEDEDKPAAAAVTCQAVAQATIDDATDVTGVIAPPPKLDAIVSSPVVGRVALVAVEEGDHVAAGALIAVIEDPALTAGSLETKAAVESSRAQKVAADQEVARQERLVQAGIGARKDLDDARAKQAAAAGDLAAAGARAGLAGAQLARREIRSPRTGVVLHLQRKVGENVDGTAGTPIAEVADISVLELHAQATPAALRPLREGMPATVRVLGSDEPVTGTVVRVAPAVDPATMLGVVRIALAQSEGIKVGTAATGQIVIARRPGIRVPAGALRRSMVGEDEVVVCEGGTAHVRKVELGNRDPQGVEVKDGLRAGEQVVVDHVLGLQDGQPLTDAKDEDKGKDKGNAKDEDDAKDKGGAKGKASAKDEDSAKDKGGGKGKGSANDDESAKDKEGGAKDEEGGTAKDTAGAAGSTGSEATGSAGAKPGAAAKTNAPHDDNAKVKAGTAGSTGSEATGSAGAKPGAAAKANANNDESAKGQAGTATGAGGGAKQQGGTARDKAGTATGAGSTATGAGSAATGAGSAAKEPGGAAKAKGSAPK